ncbi:TonB-dependent receptor plug domain-containing protein [Thalassotalea ganghwensis]
MLLRLLKILLFIQCIFFSDNSAADTNNSSQLDDSWLFNLALEDLLQVEVSVVTLDKENVLNTPAVVSRYSTASLQALGLNSLGEMLSFIPNVVVDLGAVGNKSIMIRGSQDTFNNKVLMLLDGIPYWSPSHSEHPTNGIPLNAIEYIEVIRGPGSVFYGSNAIGGVVNLITFKEQKQQLSLSIGSNNQRLWRFSTQYNIKEGMSVQLSGSTQREDGFTGSLIADNQVLNSFPRKQEHDAFLVSFLHQNGAIRFNYFEDSNTGIRNSQNRGTDAVYESYLFHIDHQWSFTAGKLSLFSDYNQNWTTSNFTFYDKNGRDNFRWRTGLNWRSNLSSNSKILTGIEFEERSVGDRYTTGGGSLRQISNAESISEAALFGHWQWQEADWQVLLGGRLFDNQRYGHVFTPRINIVYQLDEISTLKLLFSSGYSSPNFSQLSYVQLPGEPALKPEVIKMLDLAYQVSDNNYSYSANLFAYKAQDFLTRLPPPTPRYINEDSFYRYGGELDWQYTDKEWRYFINLSHNINGNKVKADDLRLSFVPKHIANLGVRYLANNHSIASSINYISDRHTAKKRIDLRVKYQYHWRSLILSASVNNLLAREQQAPDIGFFSIEYPNEVQDDKVSFLLTASWNFNND